ncbi:MAG: hypothetical protein ACI9ES_000827 [Oceanospirillaceae bacterium]|jgi:uncharacterized protein YecE (DUF72 family)
MVKIYLGLAQWHHSKWYPFKSSSNQSLQQYSSCFTSVEGNTSFYGLPSESNLRNWSETVPEQFSFCFKFPKEISHKQCLTHCSRQVTDFLNRISLIKHQLGIIWLQLDKSFGANELLVLQRFLEHLPNDFNYAVEVRSLDYYRKDSTEQQFNQLLHQHGVNRVIFDTRSLFSNNQLTDPATLEALKAKPKVPAHVLATGQSPFVRIIIPMHRSLAKKVIMQWVAKAVQWIDAGLTPYFFFHTPDNAEAPLFAQCFSQLLSQQRPNIQVLSLWEQDKIQTSLF